MDWLQSIASKIEAGEDYVVSFGPLDYRVEPRPRGNKPNGKYYVYFIHSSHSGLETISLIGRENDAGSAAARIVNHRDLKLYYMGK